MTWADRVGDLATQLALVLINFGRIFTLILRVLTAKIDSLITNLAEKGEGGITPTGSTAKSWVSLPAAVAWGVAAIVLRTVSIVTVFARQLTETLDEFLRALAEESA
ncbi:MAG TPA: hypothetical protein EYQ82_05780 [Dehalococcoidia bacterium]|jgi:uncharacterized membrane protein YjfL (UPF0719 family)|nr:hypothetical protein [Dehalococcoidia bacterium]HIK99263.1 hypothetical protein [Dehalococcoidia bacterium]